MMNNNLNIEWTPDKIKHYNWCFQTTMLAPKFLRRPWGYVVLFVANIFKEEVWDKLLKHGCFEEEDKLANKLGVEDAIKCDVSFWWGL